MATYNTHTGLTLVWAQASGQHKVTLSGDAAEKVLYEGNNMGKANAVYQATKAHYAQRQKEES